MKPSSPTCSPVPGAASDLISALPPLPRKRGVQSREGASKGKLDSRLRGNDGSGAVQYRLDRPFDLLDRSHAVDPADEAARIVIRQDRRGLGAIFGEPGAHRRLIVVGTTLELVGAADVAQRV